MRNLYAITIILFCGAIVSCKKDTSAPTPSQPPHVTVNAADSIEGNYYCKFYISTFSFQTDTSIKPSWWDTSFYTTVSIAPDTVYNAIDLLYNGQIFYSYMSLNTESTNHTMIVFGAAFNSLQNSAGAYYYIANDSVYIFVNNWSPNGLGDSYSYQGKRVK